MSDTIISAKEAYERTHKNISRVIQKINSSIESAIDRGQFHCDLYLTEAEHEIASAHPQFTQHKLTRMGQTGSMTFRFILDWSHATMD